LPGIAIFCKYFEPGGRHLSGGKERHPIAMGYHQLWCEGLAFGDVGDAYPVLNAGSAADAVATDSDNRQPAATTAAFRIR